MIPYFALLFIPLLLQTILKAGHMQIRVGKHSTMIRSDDVALPTFFALLLLMLAVRNDTVGRDLPNYSIIFRSNGWKTSKVVLSQPKEIVFRLYCWLVYNHISDNFQVFLAITACLSVIPIAYVYNKDKSHGYMKIAVFANMSTFIMLFSGIRQGLAMAIGILAYQALNDRKTWRFLFWAVLATFTHHTGFLIFLFYPLYKMRFRRKDLLWMIPCILAVLVYSKQIFNILSTLLGSYDESYGVMAGSTGAFRSFLLFVLFTVFCYVIEDETKMNTEAFALRNILTFSMVLQSFASLNPWAMRLNYYFILLIPYALGKALQCVKSRYEQVAKVGEVVISVFFTYLFVSSIYHSYVTGISALDTVPYIPFWKG